jgi:hypothetical protein
MLFIVKNKLIFLAVFCFLTFVCAGGCKGKKEEPVQEKKAAESAVEVGGEETSMEEQNREETPIPQKANTPPKIISARILPEAAYTDTNLRVEVEAEDPDDDLIDYRYQWVKIEEGTLEDQAVELDGEDGPSLSHEVFGRGDAVGVKITPSDWDSVGLTYQTRYTVIANSPPEIVSSPPETVSDQTLYTYQVEAIDQNNDSITFSLGEGAPEGMTIDSATGLLTWPLSPEIIGSYRVIINGADGHQGSCFQRFTLALESEQIPQEE